MSRCLVPGLTNRLTAVGRKSRARLRSSRARGVLMLALGLMLAGASDASFARAQDNGDIPRPGDPAPAFVLRTLAGEELTIGGGSDPGSPTELAGRSTILLIKHPHASFSDAMWGANVADVIAYGPPDSRWVFASYAATEEERRSDVTAMKERLDQVIDELPTEAAAAAWRSRLHYAIDDPLAAGEDVTTWLVGWGSVLGDVSATWPEGSLQSRGLTDAGWALSLLDSGPIQAAVASYGLACGDEEPAEDVAGKIALIERGVCPFAEKGANAERHGALAALLYSDERQKVVMAGSGDVGIPAVLIDRQDGLTILEQLQASVPVSATITGLPLGSQALAVDHGGNAREFGTIPYPWGDFGILHAIGLEARYLSFEHQRTIRMAAEAVKYKIMELPVFEAAWIEDPGWAGKRGTVEVEFPAPEMMSLFDTLEVDLELGCTGNRKSNCPPWDYLVHMYLCDADDPDSCDQEIGRWITPYWSGGRWVTDISHVLAWLQEGGTRRIAFYTQQRYQVTARFRLSQQGDSDAPREARPLFGGGAFDLTYNAKYEPYSFTVPSWATKVELVALITGHGWGDDTENCAEFCNHTHHFTINDGPEHVKAHPEAGTDFGCTLQVDDGVVPNQAGTWIFGRGGWCPGLEVQPWVVDITAELDRNGPNEITYRGLFNGQDFDPVPLPEDQRSNFPGRIDMNSYLVFHGPTDREPQPIYLPLAGRDLDLRAAAQPERGVADRRTERPRRTMR